MAKTDPSMLTSKFAMDFGKVATSDDLPWASNFIGLALALSMDTVADHLSPKGCSTGAPSA